MSVRSVSTTAAAVATVLLLTAQPAQPQPARPAQPAAPPRAPADRPLGELLDELRTRYREAEAATEAYNAAEQKLTAQRAKVKRLRKRLARTRTALSEGRQEAGRLARRQYRGEVPGVPPAVRLLLTDRPMSALHHGHALERAAVRQNASVRRLASGERHRNALVAEARKALHRKQTLARQRKERRNAARDGLRKVEEMLISLGDDRLERLRRLEGARQEESQQAFLDAGTLGPGAGTRAPSASGEQALTYALGQLGKEYEWGAEGPDTFDCSGLTSQAWAYAGRTVPRTSQQQWRRLERVPLDRLRPGDLVIYSPGATHVALYAGHGLVVHAPRPGARVTLAPVGGEPALGAVRPDPDARPLAYYQPPPAVTDATTGTGADTGAGVDTGAGTGTDPSAAPGTVTGPPPGTDPGAVPDAGTGAATGTGTAAEPGAVTGTDTATGTGPGTA